MTIVPAKCEIAQGGHNEPEGRADALYRQSISPEFGFTPRSRIDMEGIRAVLDLRAAAGLMKPPVPKAEKYIDERLYNKALASLK